VASKVRGRFTEFTGVITIGDTLENSSVEATVQAASITPTTNARRAPQEPGFPRVRDLPDVTLKSTKVSAKGDDVKVVADLTIRASPSQSRSTSSTSVPDRQ